MFSFNKFLSIGSGAALAGTGTGLGVYYGVGGQNSTENKQKGSKPDKTEQPGKSDIEDTREEDLSKREPKVEVLQEEVEEDRQFSRDNATLQDQTDTRE